MIVQLNNIDISNTVTSIGKYAFYNQKIQQVVIPPTVTHIGANAFQKCALNTENGITYHGNPEHLTWDSEGDEDEEFPNGMKVHILTDYSGKVSELNHHFAYKNITFVADVEDPYAQEGDALDRNIAAYYSSVNSNVFGGAAPYVIVGRFDGKKKSVTYGSNGFVSCVKQGSDYYMLTNNNTGSLNKVVYNSVSGKATGYDQTARTDLKLNISHTYIGSNTVKMIYKLKNTGTQTISGLKLGGTGVISTISNVAPARMKEIVEACAAGNWEEAAQLNERLLPLMDGLFKTTNPILVKEALKLVGFPVGGVRLPLIDATPEQSAELEATMREVGVL